MKVALTMMLLKNFIIQTRRIPMLRWAITFFIIAIIAAVFGFGGIAGAATDIAKILFFVFLVLLIVSLVINAVKGKGPSV